MKRSILVFALLILAVGCQKAEEPKIAARSNEIIRKVIPEKTEKLQSIDEEVEKTLTQVQKTLAQKKEEPRVVLKAPLSTLTVYSDKNSPDNHFAPSGWMGDYSDISMNLGSTESPYSGTTCIKIVYSNKASQGARWGGIYWQNPGGNWGSLPNAGFNLDNAQKLTFWARGQIGGERIEEVKIGGLSGRYPDSDTAGIGPIELTKEWAQYTIDLTNKNLTHIIGGFAWSTNLNVNPNGATFYLDEIRYE